MVVRGAGGLGKVVVMIGRDNNISILISDCIFYNNSGVFGANMAVVCDIGELNNPLTHQLVAVYINNCSFYQGNALVGGGGVYIHTGHNLPMANLKIYISNSRFFNNTARKGGGVYVSSNMKLTDSPDNSETRLSDSTIEQNEAAVPTHTTLQFS